MDQVLAAVGYQGEWTRTMFVGGLILVRVAVIISLIPFLFGNPVPNMVRTGSSLVLMIIIYPIVSPTVPDNIMSNGLFLVALMLKEAFYGLAIGLSASLIFYGFDAAGQVIDNQRGASMAQIFSPQTRQQVTIFGSFSFQLAVVLFLTLGGHRLFLQSMLDSFIRLPIYEMPAQDPSFLALMDHFISISGMVLFIAAQLAAPILIAIFIVDLVLGIMNRISPAVNVLTLGFAIRGVLGVGIFFVAITVIAHQMELISYQSIDNVKQTIRFLAGG